MSHPRKTNQETLAPLATLYQETKRLQRKRGNWSYVFEDAVGLYDTVSNLCPTRILELGTAIGFTSCVMALAAPQAAIDTIDKDDVNVELARHNTAWLSLSSRITVHHGDFNTVIDTLDTEYDFAFFDGFAPEITLLKKIHHRLASQGVLACSNLSLQRCQSHGVFDFCRNLARTAAYRASQHAHLQKTLRMKITRGNCL